MANSDHRYEMLHHRELCKLSWVVVCAWKPIVFTRPADPGSGKKFCSRDQDGSVVPLGPRSTPGFDFRVFPPRDKTCGFGHWGVEEVSLYALPSCRCLSFFLAQHL